MQESRFLLCSFQFSAWAFIYKKESYNLHFVYNQAETKEKKNSIFLIIKNLWCESDLSPKIVTKKSHSV